MNTDTWMNKTTVFSSECEEKFKIALVCFILLCDWSEKNSCHPLNQLDAKLNLTVTWSPAFSRALSSSLVFTLRSDWLLVVFSYVFIG